MSLSRHPYLANEHCKMAVFCGCRGEPTEWREEIPVHRSEAEDIGRDGEKSKLSKICDDQLLPTGA